MKTVSTIGELVRDQRKQRGWSQTQLAEKADVSRFWIGHLEKGKEGDVPAIAMFGVPIF